MSKLLENRVALITGGTSGIGEATVEMFAAQGAKVMFCGRWEDKGAEIAQRLGANVRYVRADVLHEEQIKAAVDRTVADFGRIDILFNNAGGATAGNVEDVTQEQFRHAMDFLVGSVIFGMKHAAPHMKKQGWGRIINNSSISAFRTHMAQYLYSGAKAAVSQMTRMAGMELGPHGITVNAICPGAIATPVFYGGSERARTLDDATNKAKMSKLMGNLAKANPLRRSGVPADVAGAAVWLASDLAGFVNAQEIVVDGGMSSGGRDNYAS